MRQRCKTVAYATLALLYSLSCVNAADQKVVKVLPWTLNVVGYPADDGCETSDIASSFDGARKWVADSSGSIVLHSTEETKQQIKFVYYDGVLKQEVVRIFYRDMATCEANLKKTR